MDEVIHTAVKGVDPGEPGQATSTEGLHPPFLSLSHSLISDVFKRPSLFPTAHVNLLFFSLILEKLLSSPRRRR